MLSLTEKGGKLPASLSHVHDYSARQDTSVTQTHSLSSSGDTTQHAAAGWFLLLRPDTQQKVPKQMKNLVCLRTGCHATGQAQSCNSRSIRLLTYILKDQEVLKTLRL